MLQLTYICFFGKIGVICWYPQRIFWKFWFFGDFQQFQKQILVKNDKNGQNSSFEVRKMAEKLKYFKNPLSVPRYYPNLATKPYLGHLDILLVRYMHTNAIFWVKFGRFSHWNCRNRARTLGSKIRGGGRLLIFGKCSHPPGPYFGPPRLLIFRESSHPFTWFRLFSLKEY